MSQNDNNNTFDKDTIVRARIASTIVASPFLTYCRSCGASAVKKGKYGLFAFDGTIHICSSSKEERLKRRPVL
jgi:hypothetical protein